MSFGLCFLKERRPVNRISMHHPVVPHAKNLCFISFSMDAGNTFYTGNGGYLLNCECLLEYNMIQVSKGHAFHIRMKKQLLIIIHSRKQELRRAWHHYRNCGSSWMRWTAAL